MIVVFENYCLQQCMRVRHLESLVGLKFKLAINASFIILKYLDTHVMPSKPRALLLIHLLWFRMCNLSKNKLFTRAIYYVKYEIKHEHILFKGIICLKL